MTRDGLPRAYLRIDPNIDQVYPALRGTFIGLMCAAHRQPNRGRFRDRTLVEGLCGKAFIRKSFDRGDLVSMTDGTVYLAGWDEWQEGDMTVAERMRRMRARRGRNRVTETPSPDRSGVTTAAGISKEVLPSLGVGVGDFPPPPAQRGRRKDGTNLRARGLAPRQTGDAPRDLNESPRQLVKAEKRDPTPLHVILARANANGSDA